MTYRFFVQGYIVGNPATGDKFDENSRIPFSHSFGIISDQLYEVCFCLLYTSDAADDLILFLPFYSSKAAVENCKGDYVNPTNKLCSDVVQTINDVSFTHCPKGRSPVYTL